MPKMTVDFFTEGSNFESAKEYKIGEKIGSGLIGQVFEGLHKKLDQKVAIKSVSKWKLLIEFMQKRL